MPASQKAWIVFSGPSGRRPALRLWLRLRDRRLPTFDDVALHDCGHRLVLAPSRFLGAAHLAAYRPSGAPRQSSSERPAGVVFLRPPRRRTPRALEDAGASRRAPDRRRSPDDGEQPAFVGHVEGVEAEQLAGAAHGFADDGGRLVEHDADGRRVARSRSGRSPRRRASDRAGSGSRRPARACRATSRCRGAVSLATGVSSSRSARAAMMAMPCSAMVPARITTSPGRADRRRSYRACSTTPMPVVVTKLPSALPRSTTLVSPVTSSDVGVRRRLAHRCDDALQIAEREALLRE